MCGVAMPVFGPGGGVVAAIELAVSDLGRNSTGSGRAGDRVPQPVPGAVRSAVAHRARPREAGAPKEPFVDQFDAKSDVSAGVS